jgi:cobalt-zinc-cadmium efflux system protein
MAHDHSHHLPESSEINRAFRLGIILNVAFIVIEVIFGLLSDSLALLADAGHNVTDVLGLLLAWGANFLAGKRPTTRRTYGYRRGTILASLFSSIMLLTAMGGITWEAVERFGSPTQANGLTMMAVAGIGVVINGFTAWLFVAGSAHDLNIRAAFLHMAADAAVSLGVVIGGAGILFFGWLWLDPIMTLIIVIVIIVSTWGVLRDSVDLAVDAVPRNIDPAAVREYLAGLPGVTEIHDLHIWGMSTTESALTAHLVMPSGKSSDEFLREITDHLQTHFCIAHATIQVERGDSQHGCDQDC